MFHKYMYILYLLFKSKDKSRGWKGFSHAAKSNKTSGAMLDCGRGGGAQTEEKVGSSRYVY